MHRGLAAQVVLLHALLGVSVDAASLTPTISARNAHALVSNGDGSVFAWGSDVNGRLGTGRPVYRTTPLRVLNVPPFAAIATRSYHTLAIDTNGRVWSWGQNDWSQLGSRVQRSASVPGRVLGIEGAVQVAVTDFNSIALKSDGTVWFWGQDLIDARGDPVPRPVAGLEGIVQISAGAWHFFARRQDGVVFGLGLNADNQLGIGAPTACCPDRLTTPQRVLLPPNVIDVAATTSGGIAQTSDGAIWEWGKSGFNPRQASVGTPRTVKGFGARVDKLGGGHDFAYAVLADGTWWRWDTLTAPAPVPGFPQIKTGSVDIFETTHIAIAADGRMLVQGDNANGERGLGTVGSTNPAAITQVPSPVNFKAVGINYNGIIAVTESGELWTWGADVNGSLADGAIQASSFPLTVAGAVAIRQVAAGQEASFALDASGNVWAWGNNWTGHFGTGNVTPSSVPVRIPISNVASIATGWGQVLFLKNDATVWLAGSMTGYYRQTPI